VIAGIANALDLTDRILPRLTSHTHCKPRLLHFPPYTREEIATILKARVGRREEKEGQQEVIVDPAAIEFCARKVSSVHGDLRKALDICRRAIEMVESQSHRPTHPASPPHPHTPPHTPTSRQAHNKTTTSTVPPPPLRVKLPHIASVISSVYATTGAASLSRSTPHSLPLQQKLAVATLLLCVRGKSAKEVTLGRLQDAYGRVCRQWQLKTEGVAEFVGLCQVLESRGLLAIRKAKETRMTKVTLKLQESEVEQVLQDQPLLSTVLNQSRTQ
jgi:cell division control protein 6